MIRILLVDDQNLVRQGIKLLLEQDEEFRVVGMVKDGKSAIEQINFLHPDIVLLDIEMPGMNGISITKYINYFFPHTKVIILSSHENKKYLIQALVAGAKSYILKNSLMTDLKDAILAVDRGYSQIESRLLAKVLNSGNVRSSSAKSQAANFQNVNRHPTQKATDKVKPYSASAIETNTIKHTIDVAKVSDVSDLKTLKLQTASNKSISNPEESLNLICRDDKKESWLRQNNQLSNINFAAASSVASSAELSSDVELNIESEQKTKIQSDDGSYSIDSEDTTESIQINLENDFKFEPMIKVAQSNDYYLDEPSYQKQLYSCFAYGSSTTIGEMALVRVNLPSLAENKKINSNYQSWRLPISVKNYLPQLSNKLKTTKLKKQIVQFSQKAVFQHRSQIYRFFEIIKEYKSQLLLFITQRNIQKLLWNFAFAIFGGIIVLILR